MLELILLMGMGMAAASSVSESNKEKEEKKMKLERNPATGRLFLNEIKRYEPPPDYLELMERSQSRAEERSLSIINAQYVGETINVTKLTVFKNCTFRDCTFNL